MMFLRDNIFTIEEKPYLIFKLLCEGKSQSEISNLLSHSRAYVNQITKRLLSFGIISIFDNTQYCKRYSLGKEGYLIALSKKSNPNMIIKGKTNICKSCKKPFAVKPENKEQQFCDMKCRGSYYRGPNSPLWMGGKTFEPYCWKFNNDLKERVREFFGRKCFTCGDIENGSRLRVHHIKYNKMACCDGGGDPLMVPLCERCHNTTTPMKNRELWEKLLYNQLMERTGGKCFFTKEEMINRVS